MFHVVVVRQSGSWHYFLRTGDPATEQELGRGYSRHIATGADDSNHVRIIALGAEGTLFLNGNYVATLDFSGLTEAGSVYAIATYYKGDGIEGRLTRFEGLTVRSLGAGQATYGPQNGFIALDPDDGSIDGYIARVSMTDGIMEASFRNPYSAQEGSWSSGFLFRHVGTNVFHAVLVRHSGSWYYYVRMGNAETSQRVASGDSNHIATGADDSNHIRIIALGEEGVLYVNGNYVATLDLGGLAEAGEVVAVGAYFKGGGIAGRSTRFEGLTVWSIGGNP